MEKDVEEIIQQPMNENDLSFDSPYYTMMQYEISSLLRRYEEEKYADKPEEIKAIEKEIATSALGKFSLTPQKQKIYDEYNENRIKTDKVFYIKYYVDQYAEDIQYFRTFLSRQYEKLKAQESSEELMKRVLEKKDRSSQKDITKDPYLQLLTRTNSLKEFIDDYIEHTQRMKNNAKIAREFLLKMQSRPELFIGPVTKLYLMDLYEKVFEFLDKFYHNDKALNLHIDADELLKEITKNREFLQNNQTSLNKLTKPQYVVLEHSKMVNLTKKIMDNHDPDHPMNTIRVDNKGTTIETSITTDAEFQGIRIDSFDTLVEEAIGCLLDINNKTFEKNGYIDVPLSAIAQQVLILNPNAHISKEQGNTIAESMNKLRHIFVKVDFRAQAIAHKKLKIDMRNATIEDNALNYTKTTVNWKGNTLEVYRIHSYPPRYQYSKAVKQISGVSRDLLYLPNMNITKGVAILRRYLVEYIEGIKNNNLSRVIFFETINQNCEGYFAYESKEAKRDFRNKVTTMLKGFQNNGYIVGFSIVNEGRVLKGVSIDVGKEEKRLSEGKA